MSKGNNFNSEKIQQLAGLTIEEESAIRKEVTEILKIASNLPTGEMLDVEPALQFPDDFKELEKIDWNKDIFWENVPQRSGDFISINAVFEDE